MLYFTLGTPEYISAVRVAHGATGEKYPMELNGEDLHAVLVALALGVGFIDADDVSDETADRMTSLLSSIGETLGIQGD